MRTSVSRRLGHAPPHDILRTRRPNRLRRSAPAVVGLLALALVAAGTGPVPAQTGPVTGSLVLDSVKTDPDLRWTVSGDGRSASRDGQWGHQEIQFGAPATIPAAGTTFTWTLTARATVSNLATECEARGVGIVATATPGLHASAFSPKPGESNTITVQVTVKPVSTAPGATAELIVGCFENLGLHFLYRSSASATTTVATTTTAPATQGCSAGGSRRAVGQGGGEGTFTAAGVRRFAVAVQAIECGVTIEITAPSSNAGGATVTVGTDVGVRVRSIGPLSQGETIGLRSRLAGGNQFGAAKSCSTPVCDYLFNDRVARTYEMKGVLLAPNGSVVAESETLRVTWAPESAGRLTFDYAMADRFVLDGNGVIRPNTVQAREVRPTTWYVDLTVTACPDPTKPKTTYDWTYTNAARVTAKLTARRTARCTWRAEFPGPGNPKAVNGGEGVFDVELAVEAPTNPAGKRRFKAQGNVTVQDWLVIGLGDSLASGEGNPIHPTGAGAIWTNRQCDRSMLSYQALVAKALEDRDRKTSVTFVHVACSGAAIDNHAPNDLGSGGLLAPYSGINPGGPLEPQPRAVKRVVGDREVDATLLSIGVNDLEFGPILEFCANSLKTKARNCFDSFLPDAKYTDKAGNSEYLSEWLRLRLIELPSLYDRLAAELQDQFGPSVATWPTQGRSRVFIPEYPDLLHDGTGALCSQLDLAAGDPAWVGGSDVAHLETEFAGPLNAAVRGTGARNAFNVVSLATEFAGRGYCAANSFIVQRRESFARQGNGFGSLHPNGKGHEAIARRVFDAVWQSLYPGGVARPPRS